MARRQEKPEPIHADGAPEWMITFSDCMTLLLTFFVLLLSFSSYDEKVFWKLRVIYSKDMTTISPNKRSNRDSLVTEKNRIQAVLDLDKGSEEPTPETAQHDALLREDLTVDIDRGKVILIPSNMIFWGKGEFISPGGRDALSLLASFLAKVPNRVVISEHGQADEPESEYYGLPRAWAISQHFVKVNHLDKDKFSLSAASTLLPNTFEASEGNSLSTPYARTVEIVLLDRSIHD